MKKICAQNDKKITAGSFFHSKLFLALALLGSLLFSGLVPSNAHATPQSICTVEKVGSGATARYPTTDSFKTGNSTIISNIVLNVKQRLMGVSMKIYAVVLANPQYIAAIQATMTLYIVIYGILFTTGMVQVKVYDMIIRMIKIGIVVTLLTSNTWNFFNNYVISFFDQLTDNTIAFITSSGTTNIPIINNVMSGISPLSSLDSAVGKVISSRMFATLMAAAADKNYGIFYFAVMCLGVLSFMKSLITAMWVYVMSLVMKTLLYGFAPIFIPTILFQRTKHIFEGWLAQLVNATLQPILLFIFFVFFVKLLEGSVDNILHTPVCFSKMPEGWRGTNFDFSFWRFMTYDSGEWKVTTEEYKLAKPFPIDMIAVLTFLTVAEIANRFNQIVVQISSQISQASTNLISDGGAMNTLYNAVGNVKGGNRPAWSK